jgi:transcriptional regulator with XRE-family HTH domain
VTPSPKAILGAAVLAARTSRGMSREAVASLTGTSYGYVWLVEHGATLPRRANLVALARTLGADPDEWLSIAAPGYEASLALQAASLRASALRRADTTRSRLTARRVALGLTMGQLAEQTGLDINRVCSLETGYVSPRTTMPAGWRSYAVAIAAHLWTTCEDLWPDLVPRDARLPRPAPPLRPDELLASAETAAAVRAAVSRLTAQQQLAITVRFGLDGRDEGNQHDVGDLLGVTHQRASQVEHEALGRLAHLLGDLRP